MLLERVGFGGKRDGFAEQALETRRDGDVLLREIVERRRRAHANHGERFAHRGFVNWGALRRNCSRSLNASPLDRLLVLRLKLILSPLQRNRAAQLLESPRNLRLRLVLQRKAQTVAVPDVVCDARRVEMVTFGKEVKAFQARSWGLLCLLVLVPLVRHRAFRLRRSPPHVANDTLVLCAVAPNPLRVRRLVHHVVAQDAIEGVALAHAAAPNHHDAVTHHSLQLRLYSSERGCELCEG
mmetsp:Transcript_591/g.2134  ORF Transcript_591/g.2134 Transcript_591/m.2134 type:complete len:239 (-) Transcript_591:684-1400(-)